jgi:hypothetical protein
MRAALRLLPTVLYCAHDYKTKTSLFSTQEGFDLSINIASRKKGRLNGLQVNAKI